MNNDNSTYTVTSPDLMLTNNGISIIISSTDDTLVESIKSYVEKCITSSIIFYIQSKKTTEQTLPWMWYTTRSMDIMIVDLDTCAWVDVCAAMSTTRGQVLFYSKKNKKLDAVRLLNATAKYPVLHDWEDLTSNIEKEFYGATDI